MFQQTEVNPTGFLYMGQYSLQNHYKPVKKDVEVVGDGASDKTSVNEERSCNIHRNS